MTFCGNDTRRKNWTANMSVAEELWSVCWKDVFYNITKTAYKVLNAWKLYAKPKEVNGDGERRARNIKQNPTSKPLSHPTNKCSNAYATECKWSWWLVGSLTAHSIGGGHLSPVPWPLSLQQAYCRPQAVALNHVGGRPHLQPRVLPFASASQAHNCIGCYLFINPGGMEGWVGLVGPLIVDALPTQWLHNELSVWLCEISDRVSFELYFILLWSPLRDFNFAHLLRKRAVCCRRQVDIFGSSLLPGFCWRPATRLSAPRKLGEIRLNCVLVPHFCYRCLWLFFVNLMCISLYIFSFSLAFWKSYVLTAPHKFTVLTY